MNVLTLNLAIRRLNEEDAARIDAAMSALCSLVAHREISERTLNAVLDLLAADIAERARLEA